MYISKKHVEKKLAQAKYTLNEMQKYRGKVFVNNGVDPDTGAHPLQVSISSFLAQTRSVLQYAYKETEERETTPTYEEAVAKRPIIGVFRELRNTDVHEMLIGTHTVVTAVVELRKTSDSTKSEPETKPQEAKIEQKLSKPIIVTDALIEQWREEGRTDLVKASDAGKTLYETVKFDGETDLYVLCEKYIESLEGFVSELVTAGVVT